MYTICPSAISKSSVEGEVETLFSAHPGLVLKGHFDFGNDWHGSEYLNPKVLFQTPSLILRFAQLIIEISPLRLRTTPVFAGPSRGGALLAYTVALLIDSTQGPGAKEILRTFVPLEHDRSQGYRLDPFFKKLVEGRDVWLFDDVSNTGQTLAICQSVLEDAGGRVVASAVIMKRANSIVPAQPLGIFLKAFRTAPNYPAGRCELCKAGIPKTRF